MKKSSLGDFTETLSCRPELLCKKSILEHFAKLRGKPVLFFNKVASLQPATLLGKRKDTAVLLCSCEFCNFFKNKFLKESLHVTASKTRKLLFNGVPLLLALFL